jgi:hypothetical protein
MRGAMTNGCLQRGSGLILASQRTVLGACCNGGVDIVRDDVLHGACQPPGDEDSHGPLPWQHPFVFLDFGCGIRSGVDFGILSKKS